MSGMNVLAEMSKISRKLGEKHDDNQSVVVSGMMLLVVLVDVRRVVDTTATALVVGLVRLQLADDPQVDYEDDGEKMVCSDSDAVTQVGFLFFFKSVAGFIMRAMIVADNAKGLDYSTLYIGTSQSL